MSYGKALLARATEQAGSGYALAKVTGLAESHISEAMRGKRDVPASWVLKLARVAGIDPTEAMENHDLERSEKKRLRRQSLHSAVGGVVATLLLFASSGDASARAFSATVNRTVDCVRIVSLSELVTPSPQDLETPVKNPPSRPPEPATDWEIPCS